MLTRGLRKRFDDTWAVNGLDLSVPRGSIYGLLGPNGSGKSTTIRLLLGLLSPSDGEIRVLGAPVPARAEEVLPRIGALIEGPAFYPYQSGRQNLLRRDALSRGKSAGNRTERVGSALARVGLEPVADRRYGAYSLGMRQRLGLAAALLRPRELVLLDEPTNGLDPQGTRHVREVIQEIANEGTTVVLSTHILSEVEHLCTHAAVFNKGRALAQGTVDSLKRVQQPLVRVETRDPELAASALRGLGGMEGVTVGPDGVTGRLGSALPEECFAALAASGVPVRSFTTETPSLEDAFIALTEASFEVSR